MSFDPHRYVAPERVHLPDRRWPERALTVVTLLYPAVLFCVVAGGVVYAIVSVYSHYLNLLTKMAE